MNKLRRKLYKLKKKIRKWIWRLWNSPDKKRREVCASKKVFETNRSAWQFVKDWYVYNRSHLEIYHCTVCGKYHLTSKGKAQPPARIK